MEQTNKPEDLIVIFCLVVTRIMSEAHLSTAWVRKESHLGHDTFANLKNGRLKHLSIDKAILLTRALYKGNPALFIRWYIVTFWPLVSGSEECLTDVYQSSKMLC